ncbi:MAG: hypothetical protein DRZ76_01800 [Candidatus Nealsonbacteria bacterium]|nr:MAG: hypothetical protein DRZ76_01800 [Candidatus Nealsonbacteria bacterium]
MMAESKKVAIKCMKCGKTFYCDGKDCIEFKLRRRCTCYRCDKGTPWVRCYLRGQANSRCYKYQDEAIIDLISKEL